MNIMDAVRSIGAQAALTNTLKENFMNSISNAWDDSAKHCGYDAVKTYDMVCELIAMQHEMAKKAGAVQ